MPNDISNATWSESDAGNNQAPPTGWPSGTMTPNQVEPTARMMMGAIKRFYDHAGATVTSGGTANVQTLTYTVAPAAYVAGDGYVFIVGAQNTGATTLNINALGAKNIKRGSVALAGGELCVGEVATVYYDGTQFQLLGTWARFPLDTSSNRSTLVGVNAGLGLSSAAIETTAIGYYAGGSGGRSASAGMTGSENTSVGWFAQTQMTSGQFNTAVGVNCMGVETTGNNLTALGCDAMRDTTTMNSAVAIGSSALHSGTGDYNIAIGYTALIGQDTSSGSSNIAIGVGAIGSTSRTTANENIAIGDNAGGALTSGAANTLIGWHSGIAMTTAINNMALGGSSLGAVTTGAGNTAIGSAAGAAITTGINNTVIGQGVAPSLTTGGGNILIGAGSTVDTPTTGTTDYMNIGNVIIATNIATTSGNDMSMDSRSLTILPQTNAGPGSPLAGYTLYVDSADGKLKCIGTSATVTTLAVP